MDANALRRHREQKDRVFAGRNSPLRPSERRAFAGLRYYEPNAELDLVVEIDPADGAPVTVETSDGHQRVYRRAARVRFQVGSGRADLTLYDTGHAGFFLPFRDATSGSETYGAGRYLDLEPAEKGVVAIDFNLAYNPLCAYNDAYSCPLPPVENWLEVPIRAGERNWPV